MACGGIHRSQVGFAQSDYKKWFWGLLHSCSGLHLSLSLMPQSFKENMQHELGYCCHLGTSLTWAQNTRVQGTHCHLSPLLLAGARQTAESTSEPPMLLGPCLGLFG
jgi:hypothetical protein